MNFKRLSPSPPIGRQQSPRLPPAARRGPATVPLGAPGLDAALPEGGLELGVVHEIVPAGPGDMAATLGFGLGLLARIAAARPGPVLWATTRDPGRHGTAYPPGLAAAGFDPDRLIHLAVGTAHDVLWALEEGLATPGFAAVLGILARDIGRYDFTASRRLSLRAAAGGGTAIVLRAAGGAADAAGSTAAATRWAVAARPSVPVRHPGHAMPGLGPPRWHVELLRCKRGRPHDWLVEWDHETLRFHLAAPLADRTPVPQTAAGPTAAGPTAAGPTATRPAVLRPATTGWRAA